jgi:peptidoglycan hydrolase-like protein with peptidoglycan-binding domain
MGERYPMSSTNPFQVTRATMIGFILAVWLIALPGITATAETGNAVQTVSPDAVPSMGAAWLPTSTQVGQIQARLKALGFDPGPLDGNVGPRTITAVRAYQGSIGTVPDGNLTLELYQRLMEPNAAPASAAAMPFAAAGPSEADVAVAPSSSNKCATAPREVWRFRDSLGSSFELTLQKNGTVDGPTSPGQWQWQTKSEGIEIVYDNGMGLRVTRIGHLQDADKMTGEATDSRGRSWDWSAQRSLIPDPGEPDCQTSNGAP